MNIYGYTDFRDFIKDAFSELRKGNANLSIREILRRIGCSSPSYFKEVVIDAQKKMTTVMAGKFAQFLKLDTHETSYFLALVGYNQAQTESERIRYYQEMLHNKVDKVSENQFLELREFEYLSSWEISALREFLQIYDGFKNKDSIERKKIASCFIPKISEEQIDKAIKALETLGFIEKNDQGNYRKTRQNIRSVKKTPAAYLTLCQNMRHALEIINIVSPEERIFKNLTLTFPSKIYGLIENKIHEFCKEILDISSNNPDPEDRLYSLGLQFFPLTRSPGDKKQ